MIHRHQGSVIPELVTRSPAASKSWTEPLEPEGKPATLIPVTQSGVAFTANSYVALLAPSGLESVTRTCAPEGAFRTVRVRTSGPETVRDVPVGAGVGAGSVGIGVGAGEGARDAAGVGVGVPGGAVAVLEGVGVGVLVAVGVLVGVGGMVG